MSCPDHTLLRCERTSCYLLAKELAEVKARLHSEVQEHLTCNIEEDHNLRTIIDLRAEITRLKCVDRHDNATSTLSFEHVAAIIADNNRLRVSLQKYGRHTGDCKPYGLDLNSGAPACDCGFDRATTVATFDPPTE